MIVDVSRLCLLIRDDTSKQHRQPQSTCWLSNQSRVISQVNQKVPACQSKTGLTVPVLEISRITRSFRNLTLCSDQVQEVNLQKFLISAIVVRIGG